MLMLLLLWLLLRPDDELARSRKSFSVGDVSTELGTANAADGGSWWLTGRDEQFDWRFSVSNKLETVSLLI